MFVYNLCDHGLLVFSFKLNHWVLPFSVHVFCNTFKKRRTELSLLLNSLCVCLLIGQVFLCYGKSPQILLGKTIHLEFVRMGFWWWIAGKSIYIYTLVFLLELRIFLIMISKFTSLLLILIAWICLLSDLENTLTFASASGMLCNREKLWSVYYFLTLSSAGDL